MFKKKVIVLIFAHKASLNKFEIISLKQCYKILQNYEIRLTVPQTLDVINYQKIIPNIKIDRFPDFSFTDVKQYNKLKISPLFYIKYKNFKYLLTYELDAFIFTDKLEFWCTKGFDYIGAPWFEGYHDATEESEIIGVGNSGFSLRNINKSLKMLKFLLRVEICEKYERFSNSDLLLRIPKFIFSLLFIKDSPAIIKNYNGNEDYFWTQVLPNTIQQVEIKENLIFKMLLKIFLCNYRVADFKNAIAFSFENLPRKLYELNDNKLPFGCHGWWRYDFEFWKPFIISAGYELP